MKWIASPGSMHETGHSGPVHWDDPEGWDGREVGEGEGAMIWENSTEACILSYVKQIASPGSMHETDPEGWDGEGGGRWAQDGEHMYTHGWLMWMYGKNCYNIVKQFTSN